VTIGASAEAALAAKRWSEAYELFEAVGRDNLDGNQLRLLGDAAWWLGLVDDAIDARQRAYRTFLEKNEIEEAAMVALALGEDHFHKLEGSVAAGWMRTATRLLEGRPLSAATGRLRRTEAMMAIEAEGDLDKAMTLAKETSDIARTFEDKELLFLSIQDQGRILIAEGREAEGLSLMEEAMVAAMSGELDLRATGRIYCNMVATCEELAEYRRAFEWDDAAHRWCNTLGDDVCFQGICRVKRAELKRYRGELELAAAEAAQAAIELQGFSDFVAKAHAEMGEIRRRQGDRAGAAASFARAIEIGHEPLPGLALLRLDEGDPEAALELLEDGLRESRLPLRRGQLLPAMVETALRLGRTDLAERAQAELAEIAAKFRSPAWAGAATAAAGRVALAEGQVEVAIEQLKASARAWSEAECPYELATVRAELALAYETGGRSERARQEREAAVAAFERLGARGQSSRLAAAPSAHTAAMMFTDIVGSTALLEAMGDEAWSGVLAWHDATVRRRLEEFGGKEEDHTGDGFFAVFGDSEAAVACAIAIQQDLAEQRRSHGFAPPMRIGLHEDEVLESGGGLRGMGVHTAARIGATAAAGEILISSNVAAVIGPSFKLGETRRLALKGLSEPVEASSVVWS
jgi:class 3 adenylate cyclase